MLDAVAIIAIAGILVLLAIIVLKMDMRSVELRLRLAKLFEIAFIVLAHQKKNNGSSK
jgi:hypothetical protein